MESSTIRSPALRPGLCCDGGVLPALRCPSSVRFFNPSSACCSADAITSGLSFFPPAVLARDVRRVAIFATSAFGISFLFFILAVYSAGLYSFGNLSCVGLREARQVMERRW